MIIRKHTEIGGGIMSNIDKTEFGSFLFELRKEKGLTQRELADKLLVSAKAISKWETGANMPDVSLLIPLADILGVTVTELLKCERNKEASINPNEVERLVKKAINLKDSEKRNSSSAKKKNALLFFVCLAIAIIELLMLFAIDYNSYYTADFLPFMIVGVILSGYFTFVVRDYLPTYYDENRINFYTDGFFKMNMPGLYFNNSNWPHITEYIRIWSDALLVSTPILFVIFNKFIPIQISSFIVLFLMLGTLLIPVYIIGKKYE